MIFPLHLNRCCVEITSKMYRRKKRFLELKGLTVFENKKTGQLSITLPKKKLKFWDFKPKEVSVKIEKKRKK